MLQESFVCWVWMPALMIAYAACQRCDALHTIALCHSSRLTGCTDPQMVRQTVWQKAKLCQPRHCCVRLGREAIRMHHKEQGGRQPAVLSSKGIHVSDDDPFGEAYCRPEPLAPSVGWSKGAVCAHAGFARMASPASSESQ